MARDGLLLWLAGFMFIGASGAAGNDQELFNSAAYEFNTGQYAAASAGFSKLDREDVLSELRLEALYYLGLSLVGEEKISPARDVFLKLLRIHSGTDTLVLKAQENLIRLAELYAGQSNWPEIAQTLSSFDLSKPLEKDYGALHRRLLGTAFFQQGDPAQAVAHLKKIAEIAGDGGMKGQDRFMIGVCLFQMDDRAAAKPYLEGCLSSGELGVDQYDYVRYVLAGIAMEEGRSGDFQHLLSKIENAEYKNALAQMSGAANSGGKESMP